MSYLTYFLCFLPWIGVGSLARHLIRRRAVVLDFEAVICLVLMRSDTSQLLRVLKFGVWDGR